MHACVMAPVPLPASANHLGSCLSLRLSLSALAEGFKIRYLGAGYQVAPHLAVSPPPSSLQLEPSTSTYTGDPHLAHRLRRPAIEPFVAVAHGRRVAHALAISFFSCLSPTMGVLPVGPVRKSHFLACRSNLHIEYLQ